MARLGFESSRLICSDKDHSHTQPQLARNGRRNSAQLDYLLWPIPINRDLIAIMQQYINIIGILKLMKCFNRFEHAQSRNM